MHGPDGIDYPNEWEFIKIVDPQLIIINHNVQPVFQIISELQEQSIDKTKVT